MSSCNCMLSGREIVTHYNTATDVCDHHANCYFHSSIISYHFIHSLLMTYFTSNYCYTLKIACVCCIFACSYSLSHPFSFTIITHVGGSNGVDMGWNIGYPSLTTPTPLKFQKILLIKEHQVEIYYHQKFISYCFYLIEQSLECVFHLRSKILP